MLFKALLRRLNGGTDTASTKVSSSHRQSSHLVYEKYPKFPVLVFRLLRHEASQFDESAVQAHKIFPALEIIERSGIPRLYQVEIMDALWRHAESRDWSVREKAAKALSYSFGQNDLYEEVKAIIASSNWPSQNALHGRLLCLRFLLARAEPPLSRVILCKLEQRRCQYQTTDVEVDAFERLVPVLVDSWDVMVVSNPCPITAAAYLSIRADIFKILLQSRSKLHDPALSDKMLPLITLCLGPAAQTLLDARSVNRSPTLGCLHNVERPMMALKNDAIQRYLRLNYHAIELTKAAGTYGQTRLSNDEAETLIILDEARSNMSDEGTMAILRHNSPILLQMADGLMRPANWKPIMPQDCPRDPRHADYEIALQGQVLGSAYGRLSKFGAVNAWMRQVILAGDERSVGLFRS